MKLAQIDFDALEQTAAPNFAGNSVGDVTTGLIPYFFTAAGILLLFFLMSGGFQMMTSGGNPKAVEAGKGKIMYALIGFVIVFVAFWIVQLVGLLFGIDVIGEIFG